MKQIRPLGFFVGASLGAFFSVLGCMFLGKMAKTSSYSNSIAEPTEEYGRLENNAKRYADIIEAIHSGLILSEIPKSPTRSIRYLGATRFDRPPPGYYQYLPCTWEISVGEPSKERLIWLSLAPVNRQGFPVSIRYIGHIRLVVAERGRDSRMLDAADAVLDIGYGDVAIQKAIERIFDRFGNFQCAPLDK